MGREDSGAKPGGASALAAVWRGLCPVCRAGRIFAGRFRMNARCPSCGLAFEREPGYFVGAMYVSYALAVLIIGLFTMALWLGVPPGWPAHRIVVVAAAAFLPLVPAVYRGSRVIWIHLDRTLDPDR